MPRFVAFLRGVSPMNVKMPALKASFEDAGFTDVRTILSSGNVAFSTVITNEREIEREAEDAMTRSLGRSFYTIVRSSGDLKRLLAVNYFDIHGIPGTAKRMVSFMRETREPRVSLPLVRDHASVFLLIGREAFTAYVPTDKGPVFMDLIERVFGKDVTTRTIETIKRCLSA
jgi:uncharacterized protein (DUF1697 family)